MASLVPYSNALLLYVLHLCVDSILIGVALLQSNELQKPGAMRPELT